MSGVLVAVVNAVLAAWPRFGGMAWAASPMTAARPFDHRRQRTLTSRSHRLASANRSTRWAALGNAVLQSSRSTGIVLARSSDTGALRKM